jgi:endonuclease/exonuclease/phosphatase family metal-dependent hydrolase
MRAANGVESLSGVGVVVLWQLCWRRKLNRAVGRQVRRAWLQRLVFEYISGRSRGTWALRQSAVAMQWTLGALVKYLVALGLRGVMRCCAERKRGFQKLHVTSVHCRNRLVLRLRALRTPTATSVWQQISWARLPHVQAGDLTAAGTMDAFYCCLNGTGPGSVLPVHHPKPTATKRLNSVSSECTTVLPSLRRGSPSRRHASGGEGVS